MKVPKVVFVILHYITYEDTKECITSIVNNIQFNNYEIVVVDNGSSNNSGEKLFEDYSDSNRIHIINSFKNLGFARGNNIGFKYAKYILNADFIIMINNDMVFEQVDFIDEILKLHFNYNFDVLGPDIVSLVDDKRQNPLEYGLYEVDEARLNHFIKRTRTLLYLSYFNLDKVAQRINKRMKKNTKRNIKFDNTKVILDCMLHGSCLIFSPNYLQQFDGIFEETFLYLEEDILYYIAKEKGLLMMYSPSLKVYHKEDSSTDAVLSSKLMKRRFMYKNVLQSGQAFLRLLLASK